MAVFQDLGATVAPVQGNATKRLDLRATPEFIQALDGMARQEGSNRADIVRRAVGLYARAQVEAAQGRFLAFAKVGEGNTVEVEELIKL